MYQNKADNKKRNKESLNKGSKWEDTCGKKKAFKETTETARGLYLYIKKPEEFI
jgi:hypothetical protein